jgi:hypothetical protein
MGFPPKSGTTSFAPPRVERQYERSASREAFNRYPEDWLAVGRCDETSLRPAARAVRTAPSQALRLWPIGPTVDGSPSCGGDCRRRRGAWCWSSPTMRGMSTAGEHAVGQRADYRFHCPGVFERHVMLVKVHQAVADDDRAAVKNCSWMVVAMSDPTSRQHGSVAGLCTAATPNRSGAAKSRAASVHGAHRCYVGVRGGE